MAFYIILLLFLGGAIGWSLFGFVLYRFANHRKEELAILQELEIELIKLKKELKDLQ
jgi:hypothetical protein